MAYSILIVDDSPAMCAMIGRVLNLSGLEIGECRYARDGEDALTQLRARPADLVLTDINMPRMDGEEFVRRLGTDGAISGVSVVVVSTDATANRRRRLLELGARGYLVKPFHPEDLRVELERVLKSRHEYLRPMLQEAVAEVLETMFFAAASDEPATPWEGPCAAASVGFTGTHNGTLAIRLPEGAARNMAAGFLGVEAEDDLAPDQVGEEVCEMVNMVCGALLSRLDPHGEVRLNPPAPAAPGADPLPGGVEAVIALDEGPVAVTLAFRS